MRRAIYITLVVWAMLCARAAATTVSQARFDCPICGQKFLSWVNPSYSTSGRDEEGRPICLGEDIQKYRLHACPKCHYAGFSWDFRSGAKALRPGQIKAVRDALSEEGKQLPPGVLWPLERVRAAEVCLLARGAEPPALVNLYMLGAWLSDDAAEDALAVAYRDRALIQRIQTAALADENLAANCLAGLRAVRGRKYQEGLRLCRPLVSRLEAKAEAAKKAEAGVRKALRERWLAGGAGKRLGIAAEKLTDEDMDYDEKAPEPTPAENRALARADATVTLQYAVARAARRAELGDLGEAKALELVEGRGFGWRLEYIRLYGNSRDPNTTKGIREFISRPLGPEPRPAGVGESVWKRHEDRRANELYDTWCDAYRPDLVPDPAERKKWIADQGEQLRDQRADMREWELTSTLESLAATGCKEAGDVLLEDLRRHPETYAGWPFKYREGPVWETMALNELAAVALAKEALGRLPGKEADKTMARLSLRPLACGKADASLAVLVSASKSEDAALRTEAIQCLLVRGQRAGVELILPMLDRRPKLLVNMGPAMSSILVSRVTGADVSALLELRKHWPGKIHRGKDDRRAMAAVTVRAALARADPPKYLEDYERAIDELLASPTNGVDPFDLPWEEVVPERMRLLAWCANIHYVPHIGKLLRPLLAQGMTEYGVARHIRLLTRAKADDMADIIAGHVRRPVPREVKKALAETAGRLPIEGLPRALEEWRRSRDWSIAQAAMDAMKRLEAPTSVPAGPAVRRPE